MQLSSFFDTCKSSGCGLVLNEKAAFQGTFIQSKGYSAIPYRASLFVGTDTLLKTITGIRRKALLQAARCCKGARAGYRWPLCLLQQTSRNPIRAKRLLHLVRSFPLLPSRAFLVVSTACRSPSHSPRSE